MKGDVTETRVEKKIIIQGDADINKDEVKKLPHTSSLSSMKRRGFPSHRRHFINNEVMWGVVAERIRAPNSSSGVSAQQSVGLRVWS